MPGLRFAPIVRLTAETMADPGKAPWNSKIPRFLETPCSRFITIFVLAHSVRDVLGNSPTHCCNEREERLVREMEFRSIYCLLSSSRRVCTRNKRVRERSSYGLLHSLSTYQILVMHYAYRTPDWELKWSYTSYRGFTESGWRYLVERRRGGIRRLELAY